MHSRNELQKEEMTEIYEYAAHLMLRDKKSVSETKNALKNLGLDDKIASIVVSNLEHQIRGSKKENANKDVLYGSLWCIIGVVLLVVVYASVPESNDGTLVFAWFIILFGIIQLMKGAIGSLS
jgi:VIT1/CCC1 family predicted Fe2+/Mn2+ transporter